MFCSVRSTGMLNASIIGARKRFLFDAAFLTRIRVTTSAMDKTTKFRKTAMKHITHILLLIVPTLMGPVAGDALEAQVAGQHLPSSDHPAAVAVGSPMPFSTVFYGAAYYHEYEP
jgi:hypothetical protein